jgi:hypothetical protein
VVTWFVSKLVKPIEAFAVCADAADAKGIKIEIDAMNQQNGHRDIDPRLSGSDSRFLHKNHNNSRLAWTLAPATGS